MERAIIQTFWTEPDQTEKDRPRRGDNPGREATTTANKMICQEGSCQQARHLLAGDQHHCRGVNLSRSTVKRAIDDLVKPGLVEKSSICERCVGE